LNKAIDSSNVPYFFIVGKGFVYIFQQFVLNIDPNNFIGLWLPTWITFKNLCLENKPITTFIVAQVSSLLHVGNINEVVKDPSFCAALEVD
jgi:hypothetical protein